MRREIKGKYILAGVITAVIFILGMLLGLVIEGKRADYIQEQSREQTADLKSLQLQYQLISEFNQQKNCIAVSTTFENYMKELDLTEERLLGYEKEATINKNEFKVLRKDYIQAQVNYWLLAKKTKEICNTDFVTLLYFYSPSEYCGDCDKQGFVLTYLKQRLKDKILIFSFDSSFKEEPIIDLLIKIYSVKKYPSLIVEDELIQGFHDSDAILKEICSRYKEKPEGCSA